MKRYNVFDNDEFDVMTRDHIDTSRVHKGKRFVLFETTSYLTNPFLYLSFFVLLQFSGEMYPKIHLNY